MVLPHGLGAGLFILDDFDQGNEMRWIPEMRAEDAAAMLEIAADVGRGDRRTVAGEDCLRRDRVFKLGKNTLLERKPFRRRFEHKGGAVNGRRQPIVHRDPL